MQNSPQLSGSVYIETFGCQMNVADSDQMKALLLKQGMSLADVMDNADVIVLNGCSIREKAVHKVVSALGELRRLKKRTKETLPLIGIGGCVGQLEKESLFARAPHLNFILGTDSIGQLPQIIWRAQQGEKRIIETKHDARDVPYVHHTHLAAPSAQAYVNIMKGCDKYCTYCIVPFTRGKEKSRTIQEVLNDVAVLVEQGVREVTLLGQNVNSFGKGNREHQGRSPRVLTNQIGRVGPREGDENFPQLLVALEHDPRLESLKRVRFTSSHPLDCSDELIGMYGVLTKLAHHLHLPVQSGSDRILQKMGRHHEIAPYLAQMQQLRTLCPDIGITSDIIVGFPTESRADFEATLELLACVEYDQVYAFAYSPRPGTRAEQMIDDVSTEEKKSRLNELLAFQGEISKKKFQAMVGKEVEVLVENAQKDGWIGRTSCFKMIKLAPNPRDLRGQYVKVRITRASRLSLFGELL